MDANHHAVMEKVDAVMAKFDSISESIALAPMRSHNATSPVSSYVLYPAGIITVAPLPITIANALSLTGVYCLCISPLFCASPAFLMFSSTQGPQYLEAIDALILANAPGLAAVPDNATDAEKRLHLLHYLGIFV
ncbi:hypothetical protein FB451DRAFT_1259409 [Mycena latifolia]|nr:hypothetical protein FB451DRAFT_1259409 [Mycena latifolia]